MKCWCSDMDYICLDCEQLKKWDNLTQADKVRHINYASALKKDDLKACSDVLKQGYMINQEIIPESIWGQL